MNLMKFSVFIIVFYLYFFQSAVAIIPNFLLLAFSLIDISLFLYIAGLRKKSRGLPIEGFFLLIFFIIIFLPGLALAPGIGAYVNEFKNGVQYLILFIAVYYIIRDSKSIDFVMLIILISTSAFTLSFALKGEFLGSGRLVIGEGGNPNWNAFLVANSLMIMSYFWKRYLLSKMFAVLLAILAIPLIMRTGARKSLLAIIIFFSLYFFLVYIPSLKGKKRSIIFLQVSIGIILVAASINWLESIYVNSIMFERMQIFNYENETTRRFMYLEAFDLLKKYPLFGVGYWNYAYYSGFDTYSHSTYAEVISSTGIIGSSLWFGVYFSVTRRLIASLLLRKNFPEFRTTTGFLIALFVTQLFYGLSTVQLYQPLFYVYVSIIVGFLTINPLDYHRKGRGRTATSWIDNGVL